jgi:hypothetical protein
LVGTTGKGILPPYKPGSAAGPVFSNRTEERATSLKEEERATPSKEKNYQQEQKRSQEICQAKQ